MVFIINLDSYFLYMNTYKLFSQINDFEEIKYNKYKTYF